jgi:hypothetical protein
VVCGDSRGMKLPRRGALGVRGSRPHSAQASGSSATRPRLQGLVRWWGRRYRRPRMATWLVEDADERRVGKGEPALQAREALGSLHSDRVDVQVERNEQVGCEAAIDFR